MSIPAGLKDFSLFRHIVDGLGSERLRARHRFAILREPPAKRMEEARAIRRYGPNSQAQFQEDFFFDRTHRAVSLLVQSSFFHRDCIPLSDIRFLNARRRSRSGFRFIPREPKVFKRFEDFGPHRRAERFELHEHLLAVRNRMNSSSGVRACRIAASEDKGRSGGINSLPDGVQRYLRPTHQLHPLSKL